MAIFSSTFRTEPWWWNAYRPGGFEPLDLPAHVDVAVIGAGYAGLSCALELARQGRSCLILDSGQPGAGASTRNGGIVAGGRSVGRRYTKTPIGEERSLESRRAEAAAAFDHIEGVIADNAIDCGWHRTGSFSGAWTKAHFQEMAQKVDGLNAVTAGEAALVPQDRMLEELGSDFYRGGMVVERGAHLHPALYFKGLLDLVLAQGVPICAETKVLGLAPQEDGWAVDTDKGVLRAGDVVVATNGYTGDAFPKLQRRIVPLNSYMIATEEIPQDIAPSLIRKNRGVSDTCRLLTYYRMCPEGKRLLFGGRAKFSPSAPEETAPILHRFMVARFPQLEGIRITNAWTGFVGFTLDESPHLGALDGVHFALGCNGSGVAMMSYLGHRVAQKIADPARFRSGFEDLALPEKWYYNGTPWFVPVAGRYFGLKDKIDRRLD